jgi:hypothetical protein
LIDLHFDTSRAVILFKRAGEWNAPLRFETKLTETDINFQRFGFHRLLHIQTRFEPYHDKERNLEMSPLKRGRADSSLDEEHADPTSYKFAYETRSKKRKIQNTNGSVLFPVLNFKLVVNWVVIANNKSDHVNSSLLQIHLHPIQE